MTQGAARILVVDDEEAIRLTLDLLLRRCGYVITTAACGTEALKLIEQQTFDLLLLDLMMPGLSGLDVMRRAQELQPTAAILILTGNSALAGMNEAPCLDQCDVLFKTASPQEVLERITSLIAAQPTPCAAKARAQ